MMIVMIMMIMTMTMTVTVTVTVTIVMILIQIMMMNVLYELGTCRTSLVSPKQSVLRISIRATIISDMHIGHNECI